MSSLRPFPGIFVLLMLASGRTLAAAIPAPPLDTQQAGTAVVFYAQPETSEDFWPILFQVVRVDLAEGGAELEQNPVLIRASTDLLGVSFSRIISIKLLGRCDGLPQAYHAQARGPLGWVLLVSGKIQPFVSIDCTRIAQVLRPATAGLNDKGRQYAMAQAVAHVLIHEWMHIATQSSAHAAHGIRQANLSVSELIGETRNNHLAARNR
jgi:hypothetical protein